MRDVAVLDLALHPLLPDLAGDVEDLGHVVRDVLALFGQRAAAAAPSGAWPFASPCFVSPIAFPPIGRHAGRRLLGR
jgi:hypothetical protein